VLENPQLVCFDLPCLVVLRPGTAGEAMNRALRRLGFESETVLHQRASAIGVTWPGSAARRALAEVFGAGVWGRTAAAAFDDAFGAAVARHGADVADGASAAVAQLRGRGSHVCVTTQFSAATREAVLDVLQWTSLVAMLVSEDGEDASSPGSAVATAILRARVDPEQVVVVSGTPLGVTAGRDAGAGCVVGIHGPSATVPELRAAGATCISSLPQLASRWASTQQLVPA
jgi:phosphoglycolate phosphatase